MSTRSSLAYGPDLHLYRQMGDDAYIYLSLQDIEYDASPNGIHLKIPVPLWEVIRQAKATSFDLVDKTDEELVLLARAQQKEERTHEFCTVYEEEYYLRNLRLERKRQKEVHTKMAEYNRR